MQINHFSPHIFYSYKHNINLPDEVIIRQVINYGEITDLNMIAKHFTKDQIEEAIKKDRGNIKNIKRLNFLQQVILD